MFTVAHRDGGVLTVVATLSAVNAAGPRFVRARRISGTTPAFGSFPATYCLQLNRREEAKMMIKTLLLTAAFSGLLISDTLSQSTSGPTGGGAADSAKFVASQSGDQLVFSKFKGTDVVGPNDESIGGVSDLLFDKSGKVLGIVVGVGGFLGIGQKNVAMDMSAFQIVPASSGAPAANGRKDDPTSIRLKVAWTKDQVQQAPDFQYYKPPADTASGGAGQTTGIGGQRSSPMAPVSPPARTQ
jgi:hypothetical protein